jgi:hypothetical protein
MNPLLAGLSEDTWAETSSELARFAASCELIVAAGTK